MMFTASPLPGAFRRSLVAAVLLVGSLSLGRAESPAVGTMPEDYLPALRPILIGALNTAPIVIQANIDLANAEANKYMAYSILWPSIGGGSSYGWNSARVTSTSSVSSTSKGLFYGGSISEPVFQWGVNKAHADIGTIGYKIGQRQFAEAYRTLLVSLRGQYLSLVVKKTYLRNLRYQLDLSETNYKTEAEKVKAGMVSPNTLQPLQLSLEDQRLTFDRTQTDYDYSKRVFMRMAGLTELPEDQIPTSIERPKLRDSLADALLSQFVAGGVKSTFQAQVFAYQLQQQKLNYRSVKYNLYPKFSASASYNLSNSQTVNSGIVSFSAVASTNYGLNANWTIFDGFSTHYQKLLALNSIRSAERSQQTYEESSIDSATNLRSILGFAARALDIAMIRRDLDKNGIAQLTEEVKLGVQTRGVLESQTVNFNGSDYGSVVAIQDYFNRWSEFVSLVGQDPILENLPARYVR